MNSVTHMAVGGMTGGLVLAYCISGHVPTLRFSGYEIYPLAVIAAGVAGGLAPDIDMPRSTAGHFLRNALRGTLIICAVFLAVMYFAPKTGIGILDKAAGVGAGVDGKIPLILAAFCIFILIVIEKSKHRGFTHTLAALLIIAAPLICILFTKARFKGMNIVVSVQAGFVLGWLSHMVIDTFNYPGTPWLWPLTTNHFNIMRVDSGTGQESAFLAVSVAVFAVCYGLIVM